MPTTIPFTIPKFGDIVCDPCKEYSLPAMEHVQVGLSSLPVPDQAQLGPSGGSILSLPWELRINYLVVIRTGAEVHRHQEDSVDNKLASFLSSQPTPKRRESEEKKRRSDRGRQHELFCIEK